MLTKALLCFLLIPTVFISCTTSDNPGAEDESVEGELNAELDSMDGVEDDAIASDDSVDDAEFDEFEDAASDGDIGADDSSIAASEGGDSGGLDDEDDEFFAEDADEPSDSQNMAEKDLQQELEKGGGTETAALDSAPPSATPEDAMAPAATSAAPGGGSPVVTSKETFSSADGFEAVAPPTLAKPMDDLGISDPLVAEVDPPLPAEKAAKEDVPVSKIQKEPFLKNGRIMNTVYIARAGDDLGTISQKLFEKDAVEMLKADNVSLDKGVNIGDKVYYQSPNRPEDTKEVLTYYEDKKLPVQYYITKQGDNIQKIGREVLGHDEAWKEIWAINDVLQTQALLPAGLKIRYWSGNEMAPPPADAPMMASTDMPDTMGGMGTVSTPPPSSPDMPESLPDLADAPPSEDPSLPTETTPMPTDTASAVPSMAPPPALVKEGGDSLLTVAAISLIGLAVIVLMAIQIKNRKRDDGAIPPSMEFTKV